MELTRRSLFQGAASSLLLSGLPRSLTAEPSDPHFFFQIIVMGGIDSSMLFDARPLEFTRQKKIHNYAGAEPLMWFKNSEHTTFANPVAKILVPLKDYFSVINGVHMHADQDGHVENFRLMLNGGNRDDQTFAPVLADPSKSVDVVEFGSESGIYGSNLSGSLRMRDPKFAFALSDALKKMDWSKINSPGMEYLLSRLPSLSKDLPSQSPFLKGVGEFQAAWPRSFDLGAKLRELPAVQETQDRLLSVLKLAKFFFESGITTSVSILTFESFQNEFFGNFDTHNSLDARGQGGTYKNLVQGIKSVIDFFRNNRFGNTQRSLFDVSTILISGDFSRTMRQIDRAIDDTGTDHNTLSNFALLAGKGIRGGKVIGKSDLDQLNANGEFSDVNPLHRTLDPELIKVIGRPYDFGRGSAWPEKYDPTKFITVPNIFNTIMTAMNIPHEHWKYPRSTMSPSPIWELLL